MAVFRKGDMLTGGLPEGVILIPANGVITKDGRLVMGAGFAKTVKNSYPGVDSKLANALRRYPGKGGVILYGLVLPSSTKPFGVFQTKLDWRDNASLPIISFSTIKLMRLLRDREQVIHLPFPGIGKGRLSRRAVLPIIELLPDCVTVWEL